MLWRVLVFSMSSACKHAELKQSPENTTQVSISVVIYSQGAPCMHQGRDGEFHTSANFPQRPYRGACRAALFFGSCLWLLLPPLRWHEGKVVYWRWSPHFVWSMVSRLPSGVLPPLAAGPSFCQRHTPGGRSSGCVHRRHQHHHHHHCSFSGLAFPPAPEADHWQVGNFGNVLYKQTLWW